MAVIEVTNLTRDYGNERGLFEVSLKVEAGQIYALLGPNGAGKSTLLRHLMGFLRSKQGTCRINNLDCWQAASAIQEKLGYLPGEINFFDDMTGQQYLDFLANYRGLQDKKTMHSLIERFELNPKIKLKKMSKGMKQKVGIVAAFMHQPEILLLDEPTSGLDPLM
ncbi:ABC transporter ATP-binding protein [Ligilactobacillus sp. Marseille-Q7487]|uniref:ABC transporter ATP-binding protein n=1 Tax=Ligilactobacillus sp. Marseille-Q7487 TaxID=3022128 RepID=UPI0024A82F9E|nr:ABC transporter ATP-binding protein [Ligilactobacillus sp. Marseille-Q7487]